MTEAARKSISLFLEKAELGHPVLRKSYRVIAVEAGGAELVQGLRYDFQQAFKAQVSKRVRSQVAPDLLDAVRTRR